MGLMAKFSERFGGLILFKGFIFEELARGITVILQWSRRESSEVIFGGNLRNLLAYYVDLYSEYKERSMFFRKAWEIHALGGKTQSSPSGSIKNGWIR